MLLPVAPDYTKYLVRKSEMAQKGVFPPTLKTIFKTHYPLPARQSLIHRQHPKIPECSQPSLPSTETDSFGDDQTRSASPGAQTDGRKEEQLETSLAVQPDDMAGKHRDGEHNPLERAHVSEEEGKVVSKCKSPSACEEIERPGEPHLVTQQTPAVDGVSPADCTRSLDRGGNFSFQAEVGKDLETTSRCSPFREIGDVWQQQGMTARSSVRGRKYLFQADVEVNDEKTTTTARVTAGEESARLPVDRQQRGTTLTEQNKQFDPGG